MSTQTEFREWLKRHALHFQTYTPREVAELAYYVGFPLDVIFADINVGWR